jgi:DNA-binding beta-propeller fold protein YncE
MLGLRFETGGAGTVVVADDFMELTSEGIGRVHGIDFIDDRTLVVANRDGVVTLLEVPEGPPAGRSLQVAVIAEVRGFEGAKVDSPGSVAVGRTPDGLAELVICNNYVNHVTRHVLDPREGFREASSAVAYRRGLEIPDGVAVSNDGGWTAISSHYTHDVKIFAAGQPNGDIPAPVGALRKVNYPHGLRFTPDDEHVLVADAGSPFVNVYARGQGWSGSRKPGRSVVVLDEATFMRGRKNPEEGGPKGLDIDRTGNLLAVTCEQQALAFFSLEAFTGVPAAQTGATSAR